MRRPALAGTTLLLSAALAVGATIGLGACSSTRHLSSADSAMLKAEVSAVRSAAQVGDTAGAQRALAELRSSVDRLRVQGQLSSSSAANILSGVAAVEGQLVSVATATTVRATTTTSTTSPDQRKHHGDHGGGGGGD